MSSTLGWIRPIYFGVEDGEPVAAFSEEDFEKIRQGYGCPRCWQEFSVVMVKCPVCQLDLTGELDRQIREYPAEWTPGDYEKKDRSRG